MDRPARKPLQFSRPERRAILSRHFIDVVEPLIEAGEPYADLSVERIIRAGGISRSTFYAYFEDKGDLLRAMAQDVIGDLVGVGHHWWELPPDASRDDLREALRPPVDTYRAHRTILGAVVETAAYDPRVREQQNRLIESTVASLTEHIERAQREGAAEAGLDARRTAQWLIWMTERGLYQLVSAAGDEEGAQLLEALTDVVWRTLYDGHRGARRARRRAR